MSLNIIGISALYHDSACCILQDGVLKAAVQEERFSRQKNDPGIPHQSFKACLKAAGITVKDVDYIVYYELPEKKLARQLWSGLYHQARERLYACRPEEVERSIRQELGYEGPIRFVEHHQSHAASAFYFSGFEEAAILTVDGVGEWATTTYGVGQGSHLSLFEEVHFPDSIGLLYSTITSYLGFHVNSGEYKVMGLAPYGTPIHLDKLRCLIQPGPNGQFSLDMDFFDFIQGKRMYTDKLVELLGEPARERETTIGQFHKDIAKSLQVVLEEILLQKANYLHARTGMQNLCMAGGVALNCVANGRILREGPFQDMFVQPASNDAGAALGAAALVHTEVTGQPPSRKKLSHVYLGPSYSSEQVAQLLNATSLRWEDYQANPDQLLEAVAQRLSEGKVIGWFQGRMEFGPRSLGARSILADPRNADMRERINAMVKKREAFRPFAPAVLESKMREHFALVHPSPFMLETCQVVSPLALPAITHVDRSARVQTVTADTNPRFAALLTHFEAITGCPILLNTSFNVRGEPIVCSPEDALECFIKTDIDCLVIEDFMIDKSANTLRTLELIQNHLVIDRADNEISSDLYTFI